MIEIGDIKIEFSFINESFVTDEGFECGIEISISSESYSIKGAFIIDSYTNPLTALIMLEGKCEESYSYKSTCEDLVITKEFDKTTQEMLVKIDLCIDSKVFDITNRTILTCAVEGSEVRVNEGALRDLFGKYA